MSSVLGIAALTRALLRHGAAMGAEEFIEILAEVADSTETITDAEREFLIDRAHMDPALLTTERQAEAQRRAIIESARADAEAVRGGYTTSEVAQMLGTRPSNVRRSRAQGDLYVSGGRNNRETVFPAWQFKGGRPVPHLRQILPALPSDMHPLDIEAFMTAPHESLGDRSAVEWLTSGGQLEPVLELVEGLNLA